jgi:lipopolysaccharide export system protein LptA
MSRHRVTLSLIILFSFCITVLFVNADITFAKTQFTKDSPLNVTSDSMIASKVASTIEFKGNVVVTNADSVIHADTITMFFTTETENTAKKTSEKKNKIQKIIAKGNVRYSSGERKALAGKAVYTYNDEKLVLTGNMPKVITGENSVSGKKITLFQKDGRIIIEGGVNAIFNPDETNKQAKE